MMRLFLCLVGVKALYVGVGKGDGTGPSTGYTFMGMAKPDQKGQGLWTRLYARALIFEEDNRVAFISLDAGMVGFVVKKKVMAKLRSLRRFYDETNIMISGTHTHSGPSGFLQHMIFQLAGSGWVPQVADAMAEGIATAIQNAHADLESRKKQQLTTSLAVALTSLRNASINRSPVAYLNNPSEERELYDADVDLDFLGLLMKGLENDSIQAMATWFAVHPTSMNNTNHLVASDNKGLASYLTERATKIPVVAMASSNLGDVSPNLLGPHCLDTGEPCDFAHSTCPEKKGRVTFQRNEQCAAQGPGFDMFDSTRIIAERHLDVALRMVNDPDTFNWTDPLAEGSSVKVVHKYVEMPGLEVRDWATNASLGRLCKPALGQSFAAGTIDGPGAFSFAQNSTSWNPLWDVLAEVLADFGSKNKSEYAYFPECHAPKDVFIPTGAMSFPYPWAPSVLPFQLIKIGSLVIAGVPTEMTTMAGRRMKNMLKKIFLDEAQLEIIPVIAGLSNEYADYTTTFEEYQVQRYEGGSTIYGPYQLDAYLQEFASLARRLINDDTSEESEPTPEDFSGDLDLWPWLKLKAARTERPPSYGDFGDVLGFTTEANVVTVDFIGGDLKHDLKLGGTYLEIQRLVNDNWVTVLTDSDPETRIICVDADDDYKRVSIRFDATSATPGTYQILYHGNAKVRDGGIRARVIAFDGVSPTFKVTSSSDTLAVDS